MSTNLFLRSKGYTIFQDTTITSVWIGGTTSSSMPNTWTWTDGTPFDFVEWSPDQPLTENHSISLSLTNGKWQSEHYSKEKPFICAVKKDSPISNCPLGWIYYPPTRACFGMSYRGQKHPIVTNWEEGKRLCNNLGGDLPSFHDVYEFNVLQAFIISSMRPIWIGLQSTDNSNTWSWSDGSNIDYLPWYQQKGFPIKMDISCGMAEMSFITNQDCDTKSWVICKQPSL